MEGNTFHFTPLFAHLTVVCDSQHYTNMNYTLYICLMNIIADTPLCRMVCDCHYILC